MEKILDATDTVGMVFESQVPFKVFLDTFAEGWFLEFCYTKDDPADRVWKRWHSRPIQEHGEGSHILVYGMEDVRYRLASGTVGATGYQTDIKVLPFR